jgi:penicillin amidase
MVNKWKARILFVLLVVLTILLSRHMGMLPPLANLISPFSGFWQNAEKQVPEMPEKITSSHLNAAVRVKWDYNMVPHIFAGNEEDMIYAQGYVTASMRLFQMEFFYRQAAGRLSELMGPAFLNSDRFYRRMGL